MHEAFKMKHDLSKPLHNRTFWGVNNDYVLA